MKYQYGFLAPFLSEAVEAIAFYFFLNWLMKILKPLDTIIQENHQPYYPSEPFRILRFQMRHPVNCLFISACFPVVQINIRLYST